MYAHSAERASVLQNGMSHSAEWLRSLLWYSRPEPVLQNGCPICRTNLVVKPFCRMVDPFCRMVVRRPILQNGRPFCRMVHSPLWLQHIQGAIKTDRGGCHYQKSRPGLSARNRTSTFTDRSRVHIIHRARCKLGQSHGNSY
jgi:hypothetical protein